MPKNGWTIAAAGLLFCAFAPVLSAAPRSLASGGAPFTVDKWDTDTEDGLPNNEVVAMTQTRDGYLWLGTLNGLVRFDGVHFTVFDENNTPGRNSSRLVSLYEHHRYNVWLGTQTAG